MSKTLPALLWEFWRFSKWRLVLTFCAMLIAPAFATLANAQTDWDEFKALRFPPMDWWAQMVSIWLNLVICLLMVGSRVAYPTRHYSLPISTRQLVFIRLVPGALACAGLSLLIARLFNGVVHADLPYWGPALTYGMSYMFGYAVVSLVYGRENLRTLAGLGIGILSGFWIFGHYEVYWSFGPEMRWPDIGVVEAVIVAMTTLAAWWITETGLALDRKGRGCTQPAIRSERPAADSEIRRSMVRRFRSPFGALFWQEWKQDGWLWPLALASAFGFAVGIHLTATIYYRAELGSHDRNRELIAFPLMFMVMAAFLPWCMGAVTAQGRKSQANNPMPKSLATMPVSDALLAWVSIARSLASVLLSWLCIISMTTVWVIGLSLVQRQFIWPVIVEPGMPSLFVMTVSFLGWTGLAAWFTTGVGTSTGLSGRSWIAFLPVVIIPTWIAGTMLLYGLFPQAANDLGPLILSGVLLALIGGSLAAYARALIGNVIGIKSVVLGLGILIAVEWLLAAFIFSGRAPQVQTENEFGIFWRFALLFALAAAPPAVVPLAVHYNRHR